MKNGNFELEVCLGADTKPLRQYGHDGRTFVEGKPGTEFTLVFRNHSSDRVEVVPSVDGLSVMDGKPATEDSEGYVVEPYRRVVIRGWRTSLKDSSKFVFERRDGSYAAASGQGTGQCGVIGVLVYREKERPKDHNAEAMRSILRDLKDLKDKTHNTPIFVPVYPSWSKPVIVPSYPWEPTVTWCGHTGSLGGTVHTAGLMRVMDGTELLTTGAQNCATQATVTCSVGSDQPDAASVESPVNQTLYVNNLGTAWGDKQADEVQEVSFARGPQVGLMEIQYNDRGALEALGIRFESEAAVPRYPAAFTKRVFCEPPTTHATKR